MPSAAPSFGPGKLLALEQIARPPGNFFASQNPRVGLELLTSTCITNVFCRNSSPSSSLPLRRRGILGSPLSTAGILRSDAEYWMGCRASLVRWAGSCDFLPPSVRCADACGFLPPLRPRRRGGRVRHAVRRFPSTPDRELYSSTRLIPVPFSFKAASLPGDAVPCLWCHLGSYPLP